DLGLDVVLQALATGGIAADPGLEDHVRLHDLAALDVGHANHRAFGNLGMRQKCGFHLGTGDVVARGDDHVVGASHEVEDAVGIAHEIVAGEVPAGAHVGGLPVVGQITAARRAAHGKMANATVGNSAHVVVDDSCLVAANRCAGGSRPGV